MRFSKAIALGLVLALAALPGCAAASSGAAAPSVSSAVAPGAAPPPETIPASAVSHGDGSTSVIDEAPAPGIDYGPLGRAELAVDYHGGDSVIQIPQIVWDEGSRPVGLGLNNEMLRFTEGFEEYMGGHPEGFSCAINAHVQTIGPSLINIVITKAYYPSYGAYGQVATWVYDYRFDTILSWEEVAEAENLDLSLIEDVMWRGDYLDGGMQLEAVRFAGFCFGFMQTVLFYEVTDRPADGTSWIHLFAYVVDDLEPETGTVMPAEQYFEIMDNAE